MHSTKLLPIALAGVLPFFLASAQSPAPIVVQAASSVTTTSPAVAPAPVAADSESTRSALKSLEEMKAKNDELLQKQEAVLQQLDQLQQAADELRIFAKRG